ncbi:hypothetical protein JT359_13755 [Candidatus Poribacteria bacterium]|nr:hypothetical protein [Candidatus Poribacteria bacterium]
MSAFVETLGRNKENIFRRIPRELFIPAMIILALVDINIIGRSLDSHWLPAVGFVLGIGLAGLGFFIYHSTADIRMTKHPITEKLAWLTGISLILLGVTFMITNNSIALVLNLDWLYDSRTVTVPILLCLGFWIITLSSKLFRTDRKWCLYAGSGFNGLLLVCVVAKLFGYGL